MNSKIDQLIRKYLCADSNSTAVYNESEVAWLCSSVRQIFLKEKTVISLNSPINVCGDLHGQYNDLLRLFQSVGTPPNASFLFLGDYIDRGKQSIEVICLLFALKLRYPNYIHMLRGNHECSEMAEMFGFAAECKMKINDSILSSFNEAFEAMPLAAVINKRIFCVHGGLSPSLLTVADISKIRRPTSIPDSGPIADLLWSDPSPTVMEWGPNARGTTFIWGKTVADNFLKNNNFDMIIRAHQLAFEGYNHPFPSDKRVVTIFTASCYAGEYKNKAAFVKIDADGKTSFTTLSTAVPLATNILNENFFEDDQRMQSQKFRGKKEKTNRVISGRT